MIVISDGNGKVFSVLGQALECKKRKGEAFAKSFSLNRLIGIANRACKKTLIWQMLRPYKCNGRGGRIRTAGLIVPNDARYRAALRPVTLGIIAQMDDFAKRCG